ncbi:MAG: metal-sulfur cluster assembly factor [Bacillaceae bacterium]|nr:metal-sulfur cluster assembly factor [Bacillaceae bacterium]
MDDDLKRRMVEALEDVVDPELGVDIVNLGLVYKLGMDNGKATVTMTLTAMGCPLAGQITTLVKQAMQQVEEVDDAEVDIVWNPPWSKERMSRYARIALGM